MSKVSFCNERKVSFPIKKSEIFWMLKVKSNYELKKKKNIVCSNEKISRIVKYSFIVSLYIVKGDIHILFISLFRSFIHRYKTNKKVSFYEK